MTKEEFPAYSDEFNLDLEAKLNADFRNSEPRINHKLTK